MIVFQPGDRVEIEDPNHDTSQFQPGTVIALEVKPGTIGDPYDKPGYRIRYDNGYEVWVRAYRVRELANPASSPQLRAVPLRADLTVQINHVSGPPVEDGDHIRRWLTGGLILDARGDWFQFQVCSGHANPADCPEDCGRNFALYRATIIGADWNA
jgi:hypothetical protein